MEINMPLYFDFWIIDQNSITLPLFQWILASMWGKEKDIQELAWQIPAVAFSCGPWALPKGAHIGLGTLRPQWIKTEIEHSCLNTNKNMNVFPYPGYTVDAASSPVTALSSPASLLLDRTYQCIQSSNSPLPDTTQSRSKPCLHELFPKSPNTSPNPLIIANTLLQCPPPPRCTLSRTVTRQQTWPTWLQVCLWWCWAGEH